jgi:hypothetical protein
VTSSLANFEYRLFENLVDLVGGSNPRIFMSKFYAKRAFMAAELEFDYNELEVEHLASGLTMTIRSLKEFEKYEKTLFQRFKE